MPGIEILPPDLTESNNGLSEIPNFFPEYSSSFFKEALSSLSKFFGISLFSIK